MIHIRNALISDLDALLQLEKDCWDEELRASEELISQRISCYSLGQYIVEVNDAICGVLYTQRIIHKDDLRSLKVTFDTQHELHTSDGTYIQLLAIAVNNNSCVDELSLKRNIASVLRDHALDVARKDGTIKEVVAMTRCSKFCSQNVHIENEALFSEYQEYISSAKDPTIFFHLSGGAKIQNIVRNYRTVDTKNLGSAILISYEINSQQSLHFHDNAVLNSIELIGDKTAVISANEITEQMFIVAGKDPTSITEAIIAESINSPFMHIIDSFQLLVLHNWLEKRLDISLPPSFLFQYTSPSAIENHFQPTINSTNKLKDDMDIKSNKGDLLEEDSVAIIGAACRFSGGINSLSGLWDVIENKINTSSCVPSDRWDSESIQRLKSLENKLSDSSRVSCIHRGSFVENIDMFDNAFFGITIAESKQMDPNQRLLLEIATKALYDSGKTLSDLEGQRIGVYVGLSNSEYQYLPGVGFDSASVYGATGGAASVAAGRISFCLGLQGPSMVIDTACSTGLVAVNQAVSALLRNECDEAVVACSNLILSPWVSYAYAKAGMTSPDGICHTFDQVANGYGRGEGIAALVLKRAKVAIRGKDNILAIVKGSAVLHDGQSASLTAPNGLTQQKLLRSALQNARLQPSDISFVEAHGTGTSLGDPIEMDAISSVFCGDGNYKNSQFRSNPLYISSVKGNIGHLETAAGIAGLFTAILGLHHNKTPCNAQLSGLNRFIKQTVEDKPIVFPVSAEVIKVKNNETIKAGVSSFGYSGTIAHVIIEEAPVDNRLYSIKIPQHVKSLLQSNQVWQFCGQGSVVVDSARRMYHNESIYRVSLRRCDEIVKPLLLGLCISEILYPDISGRLSVQNASELLLDTRYSQPALVILEYCIGQVFLNMGYSPIAMIGHSLGEYSAAIFAGVMTLDDALQLVCYRAQLVYQTESAKGSMIVTRLTEDIAKEAIDKRDLWRSLAVAAINSRNCTVISGTADSINGFISSFDTALPHRLLSVSHGFHSPCMNDIVELFRNKLVTIPLKSAIIPIISTVDGNEIGQSMNQVEYWINHLINPVLYMQAVERVLTSNLVTSSTVYLEIGPDSTLTKLFATVASSHNITPKVSCISTSEFYHFYVTNRFMSEYNPVKIPYYENNIVTCPSQRNSDGIIKRTYKLWDLFPNSLLDHIVHDQIVLPGAALLILGNIFINEISSVINYDLIINEFVIIKPLIVKKEDLSDVFIHVQVDSNTDSLSFYFDSNNSSSIESMDIYATGALLRNDGFKHAIGKTTNGNISQKKVSINSNNNSLEFLDGRSSSLKSIATVLFYEEYSKRGLKFGTSFQIINNCMVSSEHSMAWSVIDLSLLSTCNDRKIHQLFPQIIDSIIQTTSALTVTSSMEEKMDSSLFVPISVDKFELFPISINSVIAQLVAIVTLVKKHGQSYIFDCELVIPESMVIMVSMSNLHMRPISRIQLDKQQPIINPNKITRQMNVTNNSNTHVLKSYWGEYTNNTPINQGIAPNTLLLIGDNKMIGNIDNNNAISITIIENIGKFNELIDKQKK
eukprot:gene6837-9360_t